MKGRLVWGMAYVPIACETAKLFLLLFGVYLCVILCSVH